MPFANDALSELFTKILNIVTIQGSNMFLSLNRFPEHTNIPTKCVLKEPFIREPNPSVMLSPNVLASRDVGFSFDPIERGATFYFC